MAYRRRRRRRRRGRRIRASCANSVDRLSANRSSLRSSLISDGYPRCPRISHSYAPGNQ